MLAQSGLFYFEYKGVDVVRYQAILSYITCLHNPDCSILNTTEQISSNISQFCLKRACTIRTVLFLIQRRRYRLISANFALNMLAQSRLFYLLYKGVDVVRYQAILLYITCLHIPMQEKDKHTMHTTAHAHNHACTHTRTHTYTHAHTQTHANTYTHTHTHTNAHTQGCHSFLRMVFRLFRLF